MSDPRYTIAQQYFGWWPWTPKWTCPPADDMTDLPRDTRVATTVENPTPWPDSLKDVPVKLGGTVKPWQGSISGKPVQYGTNTSDTWYVHPVATWGNDGYREVQIPRPRSGYVWVEGYPNRDGAWDRRRITVWHDGYVTETILTFPDFKKVAEAALYTPDGRLVAGRPMTNGRWPQFRLILGGNEPPHRLALHVPEYAKGLHDNGGVSDGQGAFTFPRSGGLVRLKEEAWARVVDAEPPDPMVIRVADMLHFHGAYVTDRSGPTVGHASIDHQAGVFNRVVHPWTLGDFVEARDL